MIVRRGEGDFTQGYRPCRVSEVVGNKKAKRMLRKAFKENKIPHSILFYGLSGSGKTTLARIIQMGLNCEKGPTSEPCCECDSCKRIIKRQTLIPILEFNAVELTKEHLKEYLSNFEAGGYTSFSGTQTEIMLVDEAHGLTDQQAGLFLKTTEDAAPWNYFIFCTTDPKKLLYTLRNRCTLKIPFEKVVDEEIMKLLSEICENENLQHDEQVLKKIIAQSGGMPREAVIQLQAAVLSGDLRDRRIKSIPGKNNILVIAPHGVKGDDDYTNIIAEELAETFDCYAVINDRYQKPKTVGKKNPEPDNNLLDLNVIEHAEKVEENKFLENIDKYANEIIKNYGEALIFLLHGISNPNILEAGKKIGSAKLGYKLSQLDVLIGYGQWEDKKEEHLMAQKDTIDTLINSLKENKINAARAPIESIIVDGEKKWYCGWDDDRMNQYFRSSGLPVQSIQLEIKNSGFRDDPDAARKTAEDIAESLSNFIAQRTGDKDRIEHVQRKEIMPEEGEPPIQILPGDADKEKASFWTALSEKSIDKRIKVKEIDLSDRKFESRMSDYGINRERFDNLVKDIMSKGIVQNIIVRKVPDKEQYQLISGFRRLSALQKAFEERTEQESFQEALVSAKIFESLSDEDAYAISFSENLEREDLSLWEIANSCRTIREDLLKTRNLKSDIENHLASLIKKDARTVRRYLRVSTIQNEDIRKDIHNGKIDITTAMVFTREDLMRGEKQILCNYYRNRSMPSRKFESFVRNLLELRNWSGMKVEKILEIPAAHSFLTIDPKELKEKAKYLEKTTNKSIDYILAHYVGYLKKSLDSIKTQDELKPFMERFTQQSKSMEDKIGQVFKTKKVGANISIKPSKDVQDKRVEVTIAAPVDNIQEAIGLMAEELKDDFTSLEGLFRDLTKK